MKHANKLEPITFQIPDSNESISLPTTSAFADNNATIALSSRENILNNSKFMNRFN